MRALPHSLIRLIPAVLLLAPTAGRAAPLKEANITRIVNDVRVMEPEGAQQKAVLKQLVRDRQAVITGVQSRAELLFSDKTLTRLGANSLFTFREGTRDMDLRQGALLLQVPKGAGGAQIKTAAVTAAITGTTLMVEYQPGAGASPLTLPAATTPVADPAAAPQALPSVPVSTGAGAVASDVEGGVKILPPGETAFRPLNEGEAIPAGSSVMTSGSGSAVVSPAPGVVLRLLPGTTVRVQEASAPAAPGAPPRVKLDLQEGGLINIITRQNFSQVDYEVATPQGVCAARGTVFGIFVSGGRVIVLGAHGAAAFRGQAVGAGSAVAFGGGGGRVDPASAEFRGLLNQALGALNEAARRGMIPAGFLPEVRQQLERGGVRLDPAQRRLLEPPRGTLPAPAPGGPEVAGGGAGGEGKGYAKVVVLEGTVRVFITGKPGESILLKPGQMIIFPPDARRLPDPVDIDLDLLVKTSKLIEEMDEQDGARVADAGDLLGDSNILGDKDGDFFNETLILEAIGEQEGMIEDGTLGDTLLIIFDGNQALLLEEDGFAAIETLQDAIANPLDINAPLLPPLLTGPLVTNTLTTLDATTTVSTNPTILDNTTNLVLAEGRVMTGDPGTDGAPSKAEYLFGSVAPVDTAIDFQGNAPTPSAVFRFPTLTVSGAFPIDTSGAAAQSWLGLISETGINIAAGGAIDLAPLGDGLCFASATGGIDVLGTTFTLSGRELIFYGRGGNVLLGASSVFTGGGSGVLTALARDSLTFDGTASGLADIDLTSFTGDVNVNGSLAAGQISLNNEDPGQPGTQHVFLNGAAVLTANTLDVDAERLEMGGAALTAFSNANLFANEVVLDSGTVDAAFANIGGAASTVTLGSVAFGRAGAPPVGTFNIQAPNINLTATQSYNPSVVSVNYFLSGGTLDGGGNDLFGLRALNGFGTFTNLDNIEVNQGSIQLTGNLVNSGYLTALTGNASGEGRIFVNGDIGEAAGARPDDVYADGNIQAFNIYGENTLTAGGTTSSIIATGLIDMSGSSPVLSANGLIEAQAYALGACATLTAPIVRMGGNGTLNAYTVQSNNLQALNGEISVGGTVTPFTPQPNNGLIEARRFAANAVSFAGTADGQNGFNLDIRTTEDLRFGFSVGETGSVDASGGFSTTLNGGNGGLLFLRSTGGNVVVTDMSGDIRASGGFTGGNTTRGGNGGLVQMEALGANASISISDANVEAVGGFTTNLGVANNSQQSGNGGTLDLRAPNGGISINNSSLLTETRASYGLAGPVNTEGGAILVNADGPVTIGNSILHATGNPQDNTKSVRRGRIDIQTLRSYGVPTAALVVHNSSQLRAVTESLTPADQAFISLKVGDTTYSKGANGFIEIGDLAGSSTTLRADILRAQALNPSGGIKIFAGSTLDAKQQVLLYAGGLTTGGSILFTGAGQVNIDTQSLLARAGTIQVDSGTSVLFTGGSVGLYADTRNWSGSFGNFNVRPNNVTTPTTIGNNIQTGVVNGVGVVVDTRNAGGAPSAVGP